MEGNVIGTSSYSEAMDLSDFDESGYDHTSIVSHDDHLVHSSQHANSSQDPPVKIRKKPGRKPNPASPALRKAQNRAAQRAFRERKERHMKELESSIKGIKEQRDKLLQENEKITNENEIIKAENWYLKGIVLSLQLVCLQHNLVIPQHGPHVNEQTLAVLAQSIPESISSYLNVNAKGKLQISSRLLNETPDISNLSTFQQQKQQQEQQHRQNRQPSQSPNQFHNPLSQPLPPAFDFVNERLSRHESPSVSSQDESLNNMPPLSPMSASDRERAGINRASSPLSMFSSDLGRELPSHLPRPTTLNEPVASNLAAIQALRLRLRLQSACVSMQSVPFAIQPTLLQLAVPHDPRIDLIPTPHMRDRMILYRDQFDLDDCFRCLLGGSVFHGGDPGVAGNWQLPAEFFEKFWFLTIDYNLRRCTNEWRKKQGLKELKTNITSLNEGAKPSQPASSMPFNSSSSTKSTTSTASIPSDTIYTNQSPVNPSMGIRPELSYDQLQGYLGVQIGSKVPTQQAQRPTSSPSRQQHTPQEQPRHQQPMSQNLTPIQLTNGYGLLNTQSNSYPDVRKQVPTQSRIPMNQHPQQFHHLQQSQHIQQQQHQHQHQQQHQQQQQPHSQPQPWANMMMGSRNYDMMMNSMYSNNQPPN
ncbi:hypothetical protein EDC96DRAFT_483017 [Choanephora cucurbitarum]|nr:hypothetical protein EDC96DRAFT_483017 [Choanephora cucurbitarum]